MSHSPRRSHSIDGPSETRYGRIAWANGLSGKHGGQRKAELLKSLKIQFNDRKKINDLQCRLKAAILSRINDNLE